MAVMKKNLLYVLLLFILTTSVFAVEISVDGFESGTFCGGLGWNESCWTTSGNAVIRGWTYPYEGNRHVLLRSNDGYISRKVNVDGYSNINITLAYKINSFETTDRAYIKAGETVIKEFTPSDSDNIWHYTSFNIGGVSGIIDIIFEAAMSDLGDEFNIDIVSINGIEGVEKNVYLNMNSAYPINSIADITMSSTEINALHVLELRHSDDEVFCTKNVLSPGTPNTEFSASCSIPSTSSIDNYGLLYLQSDPSVNVTKYFNIVELDNNEEELNIQQVYYSPQVLQGGSIELFAIIVGEPNVTRVKLTFPDNNTRTLMMTQTTNNEYKVLVTDTYLTGNVNFQIHVENSLYYDNYNNNYSVIPYNVNFVDIVNKVGEVLNVKTVERVIETEVDVFGTEYTSGQEGKVFLQLLDGYDKPINDSTCYVSIYYPNDIQWKYQQSMSYLDEGLYVFNFQTPYTEGVYPVAAFCTIPALDIETYVAYDDMNSGVITGGYGWSNSWTLDGCYYESGNVYEGLYSIECDNDRNPKRSVSSNTTFTSVDYDFYWRLDGFTSTNEYVDYVLTDASSNNYVLKRAGYGPDADGLWHHETGTLYNTTDNFDFDGTITFQLITSGTLDATDYYDLDIIELKLNGPITVNDTIYEVIRGSGEVHITEDKNYIATLTVGEMRNTTLIKDFRFHYNVESLTNQNKTGQPIELELWKPFPCDQILYVQEIYSNGSVTNLSYSTENNELDRCVVKFYHKLSFDETYDIEIVTTNFWKLIFYNDYYTNLLSKNVINATCNNYALNNGLNNFSIPLETTFDQNYDDFWNSCQAYLDTVYYFGDVSNVFFTFINLNYNFTLLEMETLESKWVQLDDLNNRIEKYSQVIDLTLALTNSFSEDIKNYECTGDCLYLGYYSNRSTNNYIYERLKLNPEYVWNQSSRNLTYYETANVTSISTAAANTIASSIWAWNGAIQDNVLINFAQRVWNMTTGRYINGEII